MLRSDHRKQIIIFANNIRAAATAAAAEVTSADSSASPVPP